MTSNFITNLLRGPAYTKEYKEQLEAKLLKEFTEDIQDKNIFASADTFVDYCKNTYNPEGKDVAVDDFLDSYAKGEDAEYLDALEYVMNTDGDKYFDVDEMETFFEGVYEIYQNNDDNDNKTNYKDPSKTGIDRKFTIDDVTGQTLKDYLLDNETWLGEDGKKQTGNGKLSIKEIDTFFSKNNLLKDGKIDDKAFDEWFNANSGQGAKEYCKAIVSYSDKIGVKDVNTNEVIINEETKAIMRKAMEDLLNNKEKYADEGQENKDTDDSSSLDSFLKNSPYLSSDFKYVPFDNSNLTQNSVMVDKKWARNKVDYKEFKDANGTIRQVDTYKYSPNERQSTNIYNADGSLEREEYYDDGKIAYVNIMDSKGNKSQHYEFDSKGNVKSIICYNPDGTQKEKFEITYDGSKIKDCIHTKPDGSTETETYKSGKVTEKKVRNSNGEATSILVYDNSGKVVEERKYVKMNGKTVLEIFKNGKSTGEYKNLDGTKYDPEADKSDDKTDNKSNDK